MSTNASSVLIPPPPPPRWPFGSGQKHYQSVIGPYSGLEWVVFNTGAIVSPKSVLDPASQSRHDVAGDHYGGYLPQRPGMAANCELHFSVYLDEAENRLPGLPATGKFILWVDMAIHGDWPTFYAKLAEADQQVADREQRGYPARVGAHVGPTAPVVVDGTQPGLEAPAPPYSPAELAQLARGLHPTDLGYPDPEAASWLGTPLP